MRKNFTSGTLRQIGIIIHNTKMNEDVKHDLEFYPQVRERKNKNIYIARKLNKKYNVQLGIGEDRLKNLIEDAMTMDRAWRYCLQHYPKLRGSDYADKKVLEQEKQIELGYEPQINKPYKE